MKEASNITKEHLMKLAENKYKTSSEPVSGRHQMKIRRRY